MIGNALTLWSNGRLAEITTTNTMPESVGSYVYMVY